MTLVPSHIAFTGKSQFPWKRSVSNRHQSLCGDFPTLIPTVPHFRNWNNSRSICQPAQVSCRCGLSTLSQDWILFSCERHVLGHADSCDGGWQRWGCQPEDTRATPIFWRRTLNERVANVSWGQQEPQMKYGQPQRRPNPFSVFLWHLNIPEEHEYEYSPACRVWQSTVQIA